MVKARLTAIASYLPEQVLTNEALVARGEAGDWTAEKIFQKTGIAQRHVAAPNEYTSDIAVKAAERLFEKTGVSKSEIDFVVLTTLSPDYLYPGTSGIIQDQLGLPMTTGAFDVSLGCSGYVYGLGIAASLIESGRARKAMLLTADKFTPYTWHAGIGIQVILGDAGTATLLESGGDLAGPIVGTSRFGTDGSGHQHIISHGSAMRGHVQASETGWVMPVFEMNGPAVFNFTLSTITKFLMDFLNEIRLGIDDIDVFVFHQANLYMIEHLRKRLKIPQERFAVRIADVGNTTSSTIPLVFEDVLADGRMGPGKKAVLLGFGVGLSWGAVLLDWPA